MTVLRWLIVTALVAACEGYKILVVFPNPSRSHGNLGDGLVRHLLKAGHQVTYITPFVTESPPVNLTFIDVRSTAKAIAVSPYSIETLMKKEMQFDQYSIFELMTKISNLALDNKNVKNFLENSTETFDAVVAEWMFNELYSGFAAVFKCPLIWVYPFEPNFVALSLIDEPTHPAYATNSELNIVPPFSFLERVSNLWFQIAHKIRAYLIFDALEEEMYQRVFRQVQLKRNGHVVPYYELRYNASLMLSYSHYSLGQALSIPQNLIPVGGYHIDDSPPPLPKHLQKLMDESKEGIIYFSMGSNLKSKSFPGYILKDLIKIFAQINHTILWKFEDKLTGLSDNVHIIQWAPQQSILAHPNCILFITHGGLLSATEAVHFGVPIIGIPVFYDQFSNVDRAVERGFAKKVLLSVDFANDLKAAIEDMITDNKYAAKAKELSFIFHHRPVPPGASVVHWVEHVVATRGALHLRSPALLVPWYQKQYIDLLALIALLLVFVKYCLTLLYARFKQYRLGILEKKFK